MIFNVYKSLLCDKSGTEEVYLSIAVGLSRDCILLTIPVCAACDEWLVDSDLQGNNMASNVFNLATKEACWTLCENTAGCNGVVWAPSNNGCYRKKVTEDADVNSNGEYQSKRLCEPGADSILESVCSC